MTILNLTNRVTQESVSPAAAPKRLTRPNRFYKCHYNLTYSTSVILKGRASLMTLFAIRTSRYASIVYKVRVSSTGNLVMSNW